MAGWLALFFLIASAIIYAGVILYYGLSVEYMEGLTATVSTAAIFVGGLWALAILTAEFESFVGNRVCIRAEWIKSLW